MAEAKKATKAAPANAEAAAPKEKTVRGANDVFVFMPEDERTDDQKKAKKLPPQAAVIVECIRKAGKKGIGRKDLYAALPDAGLVTRQPAERIVAYYQERLLKEGWIKKNSAE